LPELKTVVPSTVPRVLDIEGPIDSLSPREIPVFNECKKFKSCRSNPGALEVVD